MKDHSSDFRHRRRRSSHTNTPNNNDLVYIRFSLPVDDLPLDIDESTLRLMIKNHSPHLLHTHQTDLISLKIYQLIEPYGRILVDTRTVPLDEIYPSSRWIEFDVSQAVENWKSGASNLGLEIHCAGCDGMGVHIVHDTSAYSDSPELSPVLNVNTKHRPRKTDCTKENHRCCRHTMDVVFKDLKGYEFIIQPKNFDAGYCRGKCPPRYNPANNHAILQSLVWKHDKTKATRPCCAPSKLMELEVLHVDENDHSKLKVSTWSDMRVLECACSYNVLLNNNHGLCGA
ncbi:Bone morphogenetic protein 6 [Pseudolycoriella hygida]|uniref:Bone morphogenetic protein 6 n=1 Tax=Pseudolycoriella hygida TaxID=35572 RepID=A0A9Q0RU10_9DIPT|nr:Bone morphogenetic protein 6 [Pseudolycoriella hygida]